MPHARLMSAAEDYARLGIKPGTVEPWEDGRHGSTRTHSSTVSRLRLQRERRLPTRKKQCGARLSGGRDPRGFGGSSRGLQVLAVE